MILDDGTHEIDGDKDAIDFRRNVMSPRLDTSVSSDENLQEWVRALQWCTTHSQQIGDTFQMVLIAHDSNPYSAAEYAKWEKAYAR